jgi:histidine triad (HIT) family protein
MNRKFVFLASLNLFFQIAYHLSLIMSCIFCKIINNEIPASKVYEDEHVLAFMDIRPVNAGHLLVVPKEHHTLLRNLPLALADHLFKTAIRIERVLWESGVVCEGTNILQNNGASAWQEVYHVHVHIIPRLSGDHQRIKLSLSPLKPEREELDDIAMRIGEAIKSAQQDE